MKRLFILIAILPLLMGAGEVKTVAGKADSTIANVMGKAGTGVNTLCGKSYNDGDSAEDCTPTANVMSESFGDGTTACYSGATGDDSTCEYTWTINGTGSSVFHHALQAAAPTGSCTYGFNNDTDAENGDYIQIAIPGGAIAYATSTDVQFSLYINDATIDAGQAIIFFHIGANAGMTNVAAFLRIKNNDGTLQMAANSGASYTSYVNIAVNTWYTVKIHLDGTAASSYFQIDSGTTCDQPNDCAFTRQDYDKTYIQFGSLGNEGAGEALDFEIGYVTVNNP